MRFGLWSGLGYLRGPSGGASVLWPLYLVIAGQPGPCFPVAGLKPRSVPLQWHLQEVPGGHSSDVAPAKVLGGVVRPQGALACLS